MGKPKEKLRKKCEIGSYHKVRRKDGKERCKKCPTCNAGEGWNTSVVLMKDDARGFLECYPCEKCLDGYYQQASSALTECYKCQLNCKRLNRYESVQCGDGTPGHCGECQLGFIAESREPNSICRKQATTSNTIPFEHESSNQHSHQTVDSHTILFTMGICVGFVGIVALLILIIRCYRDHNTTNQDANYAPSSDERLLSKTSPSTIEVNLETDGPTAVPARDNLQQDNDNGEMLLPESSNYQDREIDKDDETLSIISSRISGKGVRLFFRRLMIHNSKIEPHEELWEKGRISYPNYVLNVLIEWTKFATPKPTLSLLCNALKAASFGDVMDEILGLAENHQS